MATIKRSFGRIAVLLAVVIAMGALLHGSAPGAEADSRFTNPSVPPTAATWGNAAPDYRNNITWGTESVVTDTNGVRTSTRYGKSSTATSPDGSTTVTLAAELPLTDTFTSFPSQAAATADGYTFNTPSNVSSFDMWSLDCPTHVRATMYYAVEGGSASNSTLMFTIWDGHQWRTYGSGANHFCTSWWLCYGVYSVGSGSAEPFAAVLTAWPGYGWIVDAFCH